MGRGTSAGGGQSSLGYLFGSVGAGAGAGSGAGAGEMVKNYKSSPQPAAKPQNNHSHQKPAAASPPIDKQTTPAGVTGNRTNNYLRTDGQNCGNFITDRPSTKVHAAPGGGSSLAYLFGGDGK